MEIVVIVLAGVAAALAAGVGVLARRVRTLEAERDAVDVVRRGAGGATRQVDAVVVEITNHAEAAAKRTLLAKPVAALTPGLIRSIVNKETVRIMREQLAHQGVEADVRLRRLRMPADDLPHRATDTAPAVEPDPLDDWLHNDGANPYDDP